METRSVRLFLALLLAAAAALSVAVYRRHGRQELARLTKEAKADLRDALKAEKEVIRRYAYEPWPFWWGYPYYGWWVDRRTTVIVTEPSQQPAPAPRRPAAVTAAPSATVAPTANVPAPPRMRPWPAPAPPRVEVVPAPPEPQRKPRRLVPPL